MTNETFILFLIPFALVGAFHIGILIGEWTDGWFNKGKF